MMLTTNMYYHVFYIVSLKVWQFTYVSHMGKLEQSKNDYVLSDVRMHKLYLKNFHDLD